MAMLHKAKHCANRRHGYGGVNVLGQAGARPKVKGQQKEQEKRQQTLEMDPDWIFTITQPSLTEREAPDLQLARDMEEP